MNSSKFFTLFLLILPIFCLSCQQQSDLQKLENAILEEFEEEEGTFALAYKNLENGEELLINERDSFHAASTMKTPVMVDKKLWEDSGHFFGGFIGFQAFRMSRR